MTSGDATVYNNHTSEINQIYTSFSDLISLSFESKFEINTLFTIKLWLLKVEKRSPKLRFLNFGQRYLVTDSVVCPEKIIFLKSKDSNLAQIGFCAKKSRYLLLFQYI